MTKLVEISGLKIAEPRCPEQLPPTPLYCAWGCFRLFCRCRRNPIAGNRIQTPFIPVPVPCGPLKERDLTYVHFE
ncbi:hypothetical protein ABIA96_001133 [Bradyrhizobium sp. LB11.1]